jgi:hypothetical protein
VVPLGHPLAQVHAADVRDAARPVTFNNADWWFLLLILLGMVLELLSDNDDD